MKPNKQKQTEKGSLFFICNILSIIYTALYFVIFSSISSSSDEDSDSSDLDLGHEPSDEHQDDEHREDYSQHSISTPAVSYGPHRKFSRGDDVYDLEEEFSMVKEQKFVCSLDILLAVFQARCHTPGCTALPTVKHSFVGVTVIVNCQCPSGHKYRFCSSHLVNDIYANNLQAAASVILSGSNFGKVERMANFLKLEFVSKSTYYRLQRLYLIPEVNKWWALMRGELIKEFSGKDMVLGGDGQCDSPGFNAKNLCYFMMEAESNYILDIEVLDKRHVGLISTNMEKEAVRRSLNRLTTEIKVAELVTDASTSVKALMGIFKYNFFYNRHDSDNVFICFGTLYAYHGYEHYMHIMVLYLV